MELASNIYEWYESSWAIAFPSVGNDKPQNADLDSFRKLQLSQLW